MNGTAMSAEDVSRQIKSSIVLLREDIARAKEWIAKSPSGDGLLSVNPWLQQQKVPDSKTFDGNSEEAIRLAARAISLRQAFYVAIFELASSGRLVILQPPSLEPCELVCHRGSSHFSSTDPITPISLLTPRQYQVLPTANEPSDVDIFLQGINCNSLHDGIRAAIEQSLECFRKGLYMPATAMLAAGVEATWTECGIAVAKKLTNNKLDGVISDIFASINKKVIETRKALETSDGKTLLKAAGQTSTKVNDAEFWTTNLRERRNALHWGKAKSFIVDHSEAAELLMAAPVHIGTLEAIRTAC